MRTKHGGLQPHQQLLDRQMVPRIERYALENENNDYTDVEEVAAYLRQKYQEYQRRQQAPFRKMVTRAIDAIQRKGGIQRPEPELQALEAQHPAGRAAGGNPSKSGGVPPSNTRGGVSDASGGAGSSSSEGEGSSDDEQGGGSANRPRRPLRSGSDPGSDTDTSDSGSGSMSDDSSDPELDPEQELGLVDAAAAAHMNTTLLSLYARTAPNPAVSTASAQGRSASPAADGAAAADGARAGSPPAFAPPEMVAAAAARALAKERAEREAAMARRAAKGGGDKGRRQQQKP
ncbi:hypothetical protein TSOC_003480, partial [Tetrabaena socialis]